ncbi:hypothetical protein J7337_013736 [Fusarium musae]|uniref:Uncharacterized protein n=1 Tax=Fusarium musae TaxID=1042133 RepID=A0A9P8IIE6_9HYPO|nr:hypothetical protein J7337_013736 [Fusarium musae]KAG9495487.1 hypothetical protein J7337_013736 [Fusarium musae]
MNLHYSHFRGERALQDLISYLVKLKRKVTQTEPKSPSCLRRQPCPASTSPADEPSSEFVKAK